MKIRPNILLLMADQLNAGCLPAYGNRVVKAPNLDHFAKRATVFRNAYCNFPICAPSRYSMLTGRLPHSVGAFDNASEFRAAIPTVAHYLRLLDYETILCGKMHFVGPDQLHGYEERLITDIYPANFAWVPDWTQGPRNAPTGISMRAVIEAGPCERSLQIDYDDETEYYALQKLFDLARRPQATPFFLTVSFSHPHSPFTASAEHWNRYRDEDIDPPKVGPLELDDMDEHSKWLYYHHGRDRYTVTPEHVQIARRAYYGMISYVDDKIGRLFGALKRTGLAENTLIIFTSDHGEMLGERGMWFKQTFFEGASRVPLLIGGARWEHEGSVDRVVSLVDLMPTILDVAGCGETPAMRSPIHGRSLRPLAAGNAPDWPDVAISEYSDMGACAPCRMICSGSLKYIYTHGFAPQLYDLSDDPLELRNRAADSAYAERLAGLHRRLTADWNPDEMNRRILQSQRERGLIHAVTSKSRPAQNWSWMVRPNDDRRFVRSGGDAEGTVATKGRARFPYVPPARPDS